MSKRKTVAVLTESPDDCFRTQDAIEYIMEPLELDFKVRRVSVLTGDPRNGKAATKTEMRDNRDRVMSELRGIDWVVIVGNVPLQFITDKAGISKRRGRPFVEDGVHYLPINNPSVIRHDPNQEDVIDRDLRTLRDMVEFGGIPEERGLNYHIVISEDQFDDMISDLSSSSTTSFDIETNGLYPWSDGAIITQIGFGTADAQWILPISHSQSPWDWDECVAMVERIMEAIEDSFIVMHNGKFDCLWMWVILGVRMRNDFDTMLAHYMLDENDRHGLKYLAMKFLGAPDWEIDADSKKGNSSIDKLSKYHAHDLYYTRELRFLFGRMMKGDDEVKRVFEKILMPCARMFVEVEYDGVFIDVSKFDEAENVLRQQYEDALEELREWEPQDLVDSRGRPQDFNWGSTKQLSELLYDRLGIPVIETTKTGNPSCSESVIKRIDHPCTGALLRFRAAKQQLSFFIDGWKPYLHQRHDGYYLHPSFKLHGTVTGRLSCEHPNLQQVPRDPRIRSLITAPEGWTLIECDLSQIELRVAAELANERAMMYAFINGIDVHWLTAIREIARGGGLKDLVIETALNISRKNDVDYGEAIDILLKAGHEAAIAVNSAWKEYRKKAKAVNFGYLYGMWWKKFKIYARDNYEVIVSDQEAEQSRNTFFDNYPDLPDWHSRQKKFVRRHGYVRSISGRKRRLPSATADLDSPERREAERQAINSPVQSFANDLNLMSALQLREEYSRKIVRICGTVHDAILLRVRNSHVEEVHNRLLEIMTWPQMLTDFGIEMVVPIEGEGSIGPWGKGVSIKKWKEMNDDQS